MDPEVSVGLVWGSRTMDQALLGVQNALSEEENGVGGSDAVTELLFRAIAFAAEGERRHSQAPVRDDAV